MKEEKVKKENLVRLNTRIRQDQQTYIKAKAKELNFSEGEVIRTALDRDMETNNQDF